MIVRRLFGYSITRDAIGASGRFYGSLESVALNSRPRAKKSAQGRTRWKISRVQFRREKIITFSTTHDLITFTFARIQNYPLYLFLRINGWKQTRAFFSNFALRSSLIFHIHLSSTISEIVHHRLNRGARLVVSVTRWLRVRWHARGSSK